ncbi:MAG: tyrosinase family protein [Verrucomicrobiales bacterium]|nr:tyrosinase family protein [Verrucomicrobiales bacterium]
MRSRTRLPWTALLLLASLPIRSVCGAAEPLQVRTSVTRLTTEQRTRFVQCVLWLKTHPSAYDPGNSGLNAYDWMVQLHKAGFDAHLSGGSGVHMAPSFFPWHREYLRAFEQELGRAAMALGYGEPVTLPYWDWTDPAAADVVFREDFMGGNGSGSSGAFTSGPPATRSSPFRVRTGPFATRDDRTTEFVVNTNSAVSGTSPQGPPRSFLQRSIATHRIFGGPTSGGDPAPVPTPDQIALLPTPEQIQHGLEMTLFDMAAWDYTVETNLPFLERTTFRNYMEGHTGLLNVLSGEPFGDQIHGRVHLWIGGNMSSSSSPNDPLFWLHHANLDRIWAEWQDRHGIFNFPSEWYYLDASSTVVPVSAADPLWGFRAGTGYPRTVTSLDTLEIRASGTRYDTQQETGPSTVVATIGGGASPVKDVTVSVASLRGLRYQLQSAPSPSGPWVDAGTPVVAESSEVQFSRAVGSEEFLRVLASANGTLPLTLPQLKESLLRAASAGSDPVCGFVPGRP